METGDEERIKNAYKHKTHDILGHASWYCNQLSRERQEE